MILEILSKFYFKNKEKEIDYPFMSLEYLEKKVLENKKFQFKNLRNIYNEKDNDNKKHLYSMFSYKIKDNILEINRNLEFIKKISKFKLTNPIIKEQLNNSDYITKIYNESYELFDLSFYLYIIIKNSILFIKVLNEDIFSSLSKIDNINNKMKVIIIESLSHEINNSYI